MNEYQRSAITVAKHAGKAFQTARELMNSARRYQFDSPSMCRHYVLMARDVNHSGLSMMRTAHAYLKIQKVNP